MGMPIIALIAQGIQYVLVVTIIGASLVVLMVKNPSANAGDARDMGSIPALGRYPGEGNGNSLQYSCLENTMDRGAWWATVHGVAKSWTWLKQLSRHAHDYYHNLAQVEGRTVSSLNPVCMGKGLREGQPTISTWNYTWLFRGSPRLELSFGLGNWQGTGLEERAWCWHH